MGWHAMCGLRLGFYAKNKVVKWLNGLLFLALLLCCCQLSAETSYELPRSSVVELVEKSSGRIYPLYIQLPMSYAKNNSAVYPVIYLTDAQYSFPLVAGATRFPMNSGQMQQAIIVAVAYEKGSADASSRIRDYTPTVAPAWQQQTGQAAEHRAFFRDAVFPYIEKNYRTKPADRTFIGHSLGGLFGAYMLLTEPELFANYILGSPSVWFDNSAILQTPMRSPKQKTNVYLAVGEYETPAFGEGQDMVAGAIKLREKLAAAKSLHIEVNFTIIKGASHATSFPTTAIQGLDWIYGIPDDKR